MNKGTKYNVKARQMTLRAVGKEFKGWTIQRHLADRAWHETLSEVLYEDLSSALDAIEQEVMEMGHSIEEMRWEQGPVTGPNGECAEWGWIPGVDGTWVTTPMYLQEQKDPEARCEGCGNRNRSCRC